MEWKWMGMNDVYPLNPLEGKRFQSLTTCKCYCCNVCILHSLQHTKLGQVYSCLTAAFTTLHGTGWMSPEELRVFKARMGLENSIINQVKWDIARNRLGEKGLEPSMWWTGRHWLLFTWQNSNSNTANWQMYANLRINFQQSQFSPRVLSYICFFPEIIAHHQGWLTATYLPALHGLKTWTSPLKQTSFEPEQVHQNASLVQSLLEVILDIQQHALVCVGQATLGHVH